MREKKTVEIVNFMENSIKIGFHCERIEYRSTFLARQPLQQAGLGGIYEYTENEAIVMGPTAIELLK